MKVENMKTILETKAARMAVKFVTGAIMRKSTLPVLQNVLCRANGSFEMVATDLDVTLQAACDCRTALDGETTIPGRALLDATAGKESFELETDPKLGAIFRAGGNSRNVLTIDAGEFPPVQPVPENARKLVFPAGEFMAALKSVMAAQSTDESRFVLNGVCLEIGPDAVRLVATDGRRLHIATLPGGNSDPAWQKQLAGAQSHVAAMETALNMARGILADVEKQFPPIYREIPPASPLYSNVTKLFERIASPEYTAAAKPVETSLANLETATDALGKLKSSVQWLLPSDAVKHILRIPFDKKAPGEITVCAWNVPRGTNWARIESGFYSVTTKQIEGNFPNFRQVIPAENKERVTVIVSEFAAAVDVAEKATSEKSNSVKLAFTKNLLTVTGNSPEIGEAKATVAVNYCGKEFTIAFNPAYLLDACTAAAGLPEMFLDFIDEFCPVTISNAAGLKIVIMPMRLS
jgi:DNA polymerase III sliding clamp (beta) subunit (PCNA family)